MTIPKNYSPIPQFNSNKKTYIPQNAAFIRNPEDPEEKIYKISFLYYLMHSCEIKNLQQSSSRKALTKLRDIGQTTTKTNLKQLGLYGNPINRNQHYNFLYSGLEDDVDIYEFYIGSKERLFYFIVGDIFNVRLIKNTHIPTQERAQR